ncbi:MAG: ABC transporter permease subunit [Bacteriovoracaceae bacterium]|jgi:ABC-type nitrate/sulfonate/bicarbonate transport system permease component|nr:ABC transporter permease subunit [Bacteriovoracaceae bacterium]
MIEETLINSFYSLTRVSIGLSLAVIFGITLGFLRSSLPLSVQRNFLINFLLDAPKFPPPIAWIPFVILLFGIGEFASYIIVLIGAISPIFTATYDSILRLPIHLSEAADSLELKGIDRFLNFTFPACLPEIFSGFKSGASMGWMSVIAAEMISGQSGLGYSIQLNRLNLQYDAMIIDIFMIGVIGFLIFRVTHMMEKIIIPWKN